MFKSANHDKFIISHTYIVYKIELVDKWFGINPNEREPKHYVTHIDHYTFKSSKTIEFCTFRSLLLDLLKTFVNFYLMLPMPQKNSI
jgi:hypothetical protein